MAEYGQAVYARIVARVRFPEEADRERSQGTITLHIFIEPDGRLRSVTMAGQGEAVLRDAAIDAVRRAAPFPPPPPRLAAAGVPLFFEMPLRFSRRR
jgi:periplasmic protein TonB